MLKAFKFHINFAFQFHWRFTINLVILNGMVQFLFDLDSTCVTKEILLYICFLKTTVFDNL